MVLVQARAYCQGSCLTPSYLLSVNLDAPGDNFAPETLYVVPALSRIGTARPGAVLRVEEVGYDRNNLDSQNSAIHHQHQVGRRALVTSTNPIRPLES
jgi:hypothetical protein